MGFDKCHFSLFGYGRIGCHFAGLAARNQLFAFSLPAQFNYFTQQPPNTPE